MDSKYKTMVNALLFPLLILCLIAVSMAVKRSGDQLEAIENLKSDVSRLTNVIKSNESERLIYHKILLLRPSLNLTLARDIAKHVYKYAGNYELDPDLALSIISVESNFRPREVSSAGAVGIMQVMPQWKKVWNIEEDLMDLEVNIHYGLKVYSTYSNLWPDINIALTTYNRGPGPVESAMMRGVDPSNGYAEKVLKVYNKLKKIEAIQE